VANIIRVGTWNIAGGRSGETSEVVNSAVIADVVASAKVQILCLQEAHYYRGGLDSQLQRALKDAGLTHLAGAPVSESHIDPDAELGLVVAASYPVHFVDAYTLRNPGLQAVVRGQEWVMHDKGWIECEVVGPSGVPVRVSSVHLFPFHEFDVPDDDPMVRDMWREFWRGIDNLDGDMCIVAGDFNQCKRSAPAREYSRRGWTFCLGDDTATTPSGLALDDIAVSGPIAVNGHQLHPTFADHHLISADLSPNVLLAAAR
jgi:endonuclease/exonuclease/phosphatase family metal-dependent hydrolase